MNLSDDLDRGDLIIAAVIVALILALFCSAYSLGWRHGAEQQQESSK